MKQVNYLVVFILSAIIAGTNYFTDFMFLVSVQSATLLWLFVITLVFPILTSFYVSKIAKAANRNISFWEIAFVLFCYLLSFAIPSFKFFDFNTMAISGDRASKYILRSIFMFGLLVNLVALALFYLNAKQNRRTDRRR